MMGDGAPSGARKVEQMDIETVTLVRKMADAGWTQAAIGKELRLSKGAVWRSLQGDGRARGRRPETADRAPDHVAEAITAAASLLLLGAFLVVCAVGWRNRKYLAASHLSFDPSRHVVEPFAS
jgi:hypothetical protein